MCPVVLTEQKKWVVGDPQWGAYHRGRLYLFAGEAQQQRFLANPDHYSPVLSGYDPVVAFEQQQFKLGQRKHGVFFKNRIYLFASEENLKRFYQSPDRFNQAVVSP
jgi:YHS domain-containing protein